MAHPPPGRWNNDLAVCIETHGQGLPDLALDSSGIAVIVWWDSRNNGGDIYAHAIDAMALNGSLIHGEAHIAASTLVQDMPRILTDGNSRGIVTWGDKADANTPATVYAAHVDLSKQNPVDWVVPISHVSFDNPRPTIAPDGTGGAIIAWMAGPGTTGAEVFARGIDAAGTAGTQLPNITQVSNGARAMVLVEMVVDAQTGAFVAWEDVRDPSGTTHIYAQHLPPQQCNYSLSPPGPVSVGSHGGCVTVEVSTGPDSCCHSIWQTVIPSRSPSWIDMCSGSSLCHGPANNGAGNGSGVVLLCVAENTGLPRTDTVTIAGLPLAIVQDDATWSCPPAADPAGRGERCCPPPFPCQPGLVCFGDTCKLPLPCGLQNQKCCVSVDGGVPRGVCMPGLQCMDGQTCEVPCGNPGETCCSRSDVCNGTLQCVDGHCKKNLDCGQKGQRCCPIWLTTQCAADLECIDDTCVPHCIPEKCGWWQCGRLPDGCGGTLQCTCSGRLGSGLSWRCSDAGVRSGTTDSKFCCVHEDCTTTCGGNNDDERNFCECECRKGNCSRCGSQGEQNPCLRKKM